MELIVGRKYEVSVAGTGGKGTTGATRIRTYRGMGMTAMNGKKEPQHLFGDENNKGNYSVGTTARAMRRIIRMVDETEAPVCRTLTAGGNSYVVVGSVPPRRAVRAGEGRP
jgi:hypothetical protein